MRSVPAPATGTEHWYEIVLHPEGEFTATVYFAGTDGGLWVVAGCQFPCGCLTFVDDNAGIGGTETVTFRNEEAFDRSVYLVIDALGDGACGPYQGSLDCSGGLAAAERHSWGSVKGTYR